MINNEPTYLTLINWQVDWLAVVVSTRNEEFWHNCWPARPYWLTDWLVDCDGTNWIFNLKTGDEKWAHIERPDKVHTLNSNSSIQYSPHQRPGYWRVSEERLAPRTAQCLRRSNGQIVCAWEWLGFLSAQASQAWFEIYTRWCREKMMMMRLKHLQNWMWLIGSTLV